MIFYLPWYVPKIFVKPYYLFSVNYLIRSLDNTKNNLHKQKRAVQPKKHLQGGKVQNLSSILCISYSYMKHLVEFVAAKGLFMLLNSMAHLVLWLFVCSQFSKIGSDQKNYLYKLSLQLYTHSLRLEHNMLPVLMDLSQSQGMLLCLAREQILCIHRLLAIRHYLHLVILYPSSEFISTDRASFIFVK